MMRDNSQVTMLATQLIGDQSSQEHVIREDRLTDQPVLSSSQQNLLCIWYHDDNISENENLMYKMKNQLYITFTYVRIFNDIGDFTTYLTNSLIVEKIFVIITSENSKNLYAVIKGCEKCQHVWNFQETLNSSDISSAYDVIAKWFAQIHVDLEAYLKDKMRSSTAIIEDDECHRLVLPLPLNIFNTNTKQNSFRYWTKESLEFYRFQALTGILTKMNCDKDKSLKDMMRECRECYRKKNDHVELRKIDCLRERYNANDAILHYTEDTCLFRMAGQAFRSEDIEHIFKFRRFIIDLHCRLVNVAEANKPKRKELYRGKKLCPIVLQQLDDNIGALISINGFLSTTQDRNVAEKIYAGVGQSRAGHEKDKSVLFELSIDETTVAKPFADITSISQFAVETEVLFTIGSVWKIDSIDKSNDLLWIVKLKSSKEINSKLDEFFKQLPSDNTFLALGDVLRELGQHTKAKNYYQQMLKESNLAKEIRATLFYRIAEINIAQDENEEALKNLHAAEELLPPVVKNTEPASSQPLFAHGIISSRLPILYNIGRMYQKTDDCRKALKYFTEAVNIQESDPVNRAIVEDNIGSLLCSEGNYAAALVHHLTAIRLAQGHSCTNCMAKFRQNYDFVNQHLLSSNCCSEWK